MEGATHGELFPSTPKRVIATPVKPNFALVTMDVSHSVKRVHMTGELIIQLTFC
jgi:hypothetical protein